MGQHRIGISGLATHEGSDADAPATLAGEGPAEPVVDEPELKAGRVGLQHRCLHLHRRCRGEAGPGRPQAEGSSKGGGRAIGHHQSPGAVDVASGLYAPQVAIPSDRLNR